MKDIKLLENITGENLWVKVKQRVLRLDNNGTIHKRKKWVNYQN